MEPSCRKTFRIDNRRFSFLSFTDYVRIIHKQKSSTCSDGKLNSAMGNIFASEVHRQSLIREGAKQALDERRKEEVTIISNDGKGNE